MEQASACGPGVAQAAEEWVSNGLRAHESVGQGWCRRSWLLVLAAWVQVAREPQAEACSTKCGAIALRTFLFFALPARATTYLCCGGGERLEQRDGFGASLADDCQGEWGGVFAGRFGAV